MKNILVIYYSQSGQLEAIARSVSAPLNGLSDVNLHFHEIKVVEPFPFPWDKERFFGAFPESFLQIPQAVVPMSEELRDIKFDLILFCYQVWYLSPSIPITSFLKSDDAKRLFNHVPVVTISGSRNMWIMAQEKIKVLLTSLDAKLVGNIALVDRAPNLISVITIVEWMMSGIKKRYLGLFPLPGVADKDIRDSQVFGEIIQKHLQDNSFNSLQNSLIDAKAVKVSPYLVTVDKTANRIFSKWSNLVITKGESRKRWLQAFYIYLLVAIWVASPIVYVLHLFSYPFRMKSIKNSIAYYQGV